MPPRNADYKGYFIARHVSVSVRAMLLEHMIFKYHFITMKMLKIGLSLKITAL